MLRKCTPAQRKALLEVAHDDLLEALTECCMNVYLKTIKVNPSVLKQLTPLKEDLRFFADNRNPLNQRREVLLQKGEGFLSLVLTPIVEHASQLPRCLQCSKDTPRSNKKGKNKKKSYPPCKIAEHYWRNSSKTILFPFLMAHFGRQIKCPSDSIYEKPPNVLVIAPLYDHLAVPYDHFALPPPNLQLAVAGSGNTGGESGRR